MAKKYDAIWIFNEGKMWQNISCTVNTHTIKCVQFSLTDTTNYMYIIVLNKETLKYVRINVYIALVYNEN